MEVQEEALGSKEYTQIMKGKRTKRPRQASPLALAMASSSSSMAEGGSSGGVSDNSGGRFDRPATSPANTGEFTDSTGEEEEDMANCLILLAQGQNQKSSEPVVAPMTSKAGLYLYQCKTCNRCFSSFQALGGHRASHKKPPKAAIGEEKKPLMVFMKESDQDRFNHESTALSLQIPNRVLPSTQNNKSRVHECSVCGAEFSSGQALGGHMRRHRTMSMAATTSSESQQEVKKPRNLLSLDLNLPAPEDDRRESKFPFASKEQVIVFSASSLVDCHY